MTSHPDAPEPADPVHACARGGCHGCGERDAVSTARRISASIPDVTRSLVMLERPAAVTDNRVARITQIGPYAMPSAPGDPFRVEPGWITLRIDTDAVTGAFLVDPPYGDSVLPGLRLHGTGAWPVHRCHPLLDGDRLVLDGLARLADALPRVPARSGPRTAPRIPDELPAQFERIDDLLERGARDVPYVSHRHIDPGVLFAVLEHVCAVGLPLGLAVLSSAAMHAVQGGIESVSLTEGFAVVSTDDTILELDLSGVRHCLLVRLHGVRGLTSALELYDGGNRCVALITQFGIVGADVHDAWEQLAGSLPELA